jgi:Flp pilus assembly pilin Flp
VKRLINFIKSEQGATAVEYSILGAAIAAVIVATVSLLGGNVYLLFFDFTTEMARH